MVVVVVDVVGENERVRSRERVGGEYEVVLLL